MKPHSLKDAAQGIESLVLRQLLSASGAFKPSSVAGGQIRSEIFIETLAEAVSKSGGIGLAAQLEKTLGANENSVSPAADNTAALTEGGKITSAFGVRTDPLTGQAAFHQGVDVGAAEGSPIAAAMGGVVRRAETHPSYGQMVELQHDNGVTTLYAHASELLVKQGQRVEAGEAIARVGQTGRATGPHLHFEMRVDGRVVDPKSALKVYAKRADESVAGFFNPGRAGVP